MILSNKSCNFLYAVFKKKSADGFTLRASIRGWKCLAWSVDRQFCNLDIPQAVLIHNPGII